MTVVKAKDTAAPARPLDGLLVIAIEQAVAAPLCTVRLADAGARVIKVERPDGETARRYDATVGGMSAYFAWLNRGKESAALDLKSEVDLSLLHEMVAKADVLVQNLAPGAVDRLGLSKAVLAAGGKDRDPDNARAPVSRRINQFVDGRQIWPSHHDQRNVPIGATGARLARRALGVEDALPRPKFPLSRTARY